MEFNCLIERESFLLNVKDKIMTICNHSIKYTFDLSLKVLITWVFREKELNGFILDDLIVEGDGLNMKKLKLFLGGKITYTGIQIFYCFNGEINISKSKATKVCSLINRQTKLKFTCKCFKKSALGIERIHKEIEIQKKASKNGLAPKIYECFESKNCVYLIMETLEQLQDQAFMEEDIIVQFKQSQSFIRKILFIKAQKNHTLCLVKTTNQSQLDLENLQINLTCINYSNTNIQNNEFRLDIFKVGIIMHKLQDIQITQLQFYVILIILYQKQNFQDDQFIISKDGNSLLESLLNWKSNSPLELKELFSHPYFKLLKSEGISLKIQCMNPKFKTRIFQDEELESFE